MSGKIIYSKYSNDRAEQYCIATDLIKTKQGMLIRKRALNAVSKAHVKKMEVNCEKLQEVYKDSKFFLNRIIGAGEDYLDFEYLEGITYENLLDQYLNKGDIEGLFQKMQIFFEQYSCCDLTDFEQNEIFQKYFGEVRLSKEEQAIAIGNPDIIFQNIIIDENDKWNVIDYEWIMDCTIPIRYLQYRAIFVYVYTNSKRLCLIDENIFEHFGFTKEEMEVYDRMEHHFQDAIKDGHKQLLECYQFMGKLQCDAQSIFSENERNYIKVYFDEGMGFTEAKSRIFSKFPMVIYLYDGLQSVKIRPVAQACYVSAVNVKNNADCEMAFEIDGNKEGDGSYLITRPESGIIVKNLEKKRGLLQINANVEYKTSKMDYFESVVVNKDNVIDGMNNVIDGMKNSLSWQVTKPMRKVLDFCRKGKAH